MMSPNFPWYFINGVVYLDDPKDYQFTHVFYHAQRVHSKSFKEHEPFNEERVRSIEYFSCAEPCLDALGARNIYRVKANLNPRTVFHRKGGYHVDYDHHDKKTAILYINTCNGYTQFKSSGKVKSVANRMVIFNSTQEHQGVTCTDEKRRVMITFNYS